MGRIYVPLKIHDRMKTHPDVAKYSDPVFYINDLDPLEVSWNFFTGAGIGTMDQAFEAWNLLARRLLHLAEEMDKALQQLLESVSGPFVDVIEETFEQHRVWLKRIRRRILRTLLCIRQARDAYVRACHSVVSLSLLRNNRADLKEMKENNSIETSSWRIYKLEKEYQQWQVHNVQVMQNYYDEVSILIETWPTFLPPAASVFTT